jgi:subtilase family serine protease
MDDTTQTSRALPQNRSWLARKALAPRLSLAMVLIASISLVQIQMTSNSSTRGSAVRSESACTTLAALGGGCAAQWLVDTKTGGPVTFAVNKMATTAPAIEPSVTSSTITEPPALFGTPQFIQRSYDLTALSAVAGVGDTVGIVVIGAGYQQLNSDLAQYRLRFGLPPCTTTSGCLRVVNQDGHSAVVANKNGQDSGWAFETAMDVDAVSTTCPNCHLLVVQANAQDVRDYQVAELAAHRLGANQISNSWTEFWSFKQHDFNFPGVAVLAATGDYGFLAGAYSTPEPASFPSVTAVGGTSLMQAPSLDPNARGVIETGWISGSSACTTQPQPAWQIGDGSGCKTRSVADISADANPATGLYVFCSCSGALTGYTGGGTSLATALTAGYYGLLHSLGVDAGIGGGAWAYSDSTKLNAITSGTNSSSNGQCAIASLCANSSGGGYSDLTGVGSISGAVIAGLPGVAGGSGCSCANGTADYVSATPTPTSVTLSGGVYPNGQDTHYWWEYGPTSELGQTTTPIDIGGGTQMVAVSNTITGLTDGVNYHFALFASNTSGAIADSNDGVTIYPGYSDGAILSVRQRTSRPIRDQSP